MIITNEFLFTAQVSSSPFKTQRGPSGNIFAGTQRKPMHWESRSGVSAYHEPCQLFPVIFPNTNVQDEGPFPFSSDVSQVATSMITCRLQYSNPILCVQLLLQHIALSIHTRRRSSPSTSISVWRVKVVSKLISVGPTRSCGPLCKPLWKMWYLGEIEYPFHLHRCKLAHFWGALRLAFKFIHWQRDREVQNLGHPVIFPCPHSVIYTCLFLMLEVGRHVMILLYAIFYLQVLVCLLNQPGGAQA
jgi:hypothetical protein